MSTTSEFRPQSAKRSWVSARAARRRGEDQGFTLVELLIVSLVVPIVIGALALGLMAIFRVQTATANRITDSADAEIVSANVSRDVQSAERITTTTTPSCGANLGTQVLGLSYNGSKTLVSYVDTTSGNSYALARRVCTGSNTTTPVSTAIVSHDSPKALTATVNCAVTIAYCAPNLGWLLTAGVSSVVVSVTEPGANYTYNLTVVPRAWTPVSGGMPVDPFPIVPLQLTNTAACPQSVLTDAGSSIINVAGGSGTINLFSSCASTVKITGSSQINASGGIVTGNSSLNSIATGSGYLAGPPQSYSSSLSDPFASLKAPAMPSTATKSSCTTVTSGSSTVTCNPGEYATSPALTNSAKTIFQNSTANCTPSTCTFIFDAAVNITGATTTTFGAGTYWFKGGLNLSNSAVVSFGTGTYIMGTSSMSASTNSFTATGAEVLNGDSAGNLFYIAGGVVNIGNSAHVSLSGLSSYYGTSIWDAAGTTSTSTPQLTLSGDACVSSAYGGIYDPSGLLTVANSGNLSAAFVIADSLVLTGASQLNVG